MDSPKVTVARDSHRSKSVVANQRIGPGEQIASFDGEIYSWTERDVPNEPPLFIRDHAIQFHPYRCRDSRGVARWINHSCEVTIQVPRASKFIEN